MFELLPDDMINLIISYVGDLGLFVFLRVNIRFYNLFKNRPINRDKLCFLSLSTLCTRNSLGFDLFTWLRKNGCIWFTPEVLKRRYYPKVFSLV